MTGLFRIRRRPVMGTFGERRTSLVLSLLLVAAAGVVLGGALGRLPPLFFVGAVLAAGFAWLVFVYPLVGILTVIAGTAFVPFRQAMPGTDIHSINIPDLILVFCCGVVVTKCLLQRQKWVWSPIDLPLLLFVLAGILAFVRSVYILGANKFEAILEFRVMLYYLLPLLIVNVVKDRRDLRRLIGGVMAIACMWAIYGILRGSLQSPANTAPADVVYYALSTLAVGSGNVLVYWLVVCSISLLIIGGVRRLYILTAVLAAGYFALMFHRHMYLACAYALVALAAILFTRYRRHLTRITVGLIVLGMCLVTFGYWGPAPVRRYTALTVERVQSLVGISETETVKYRQRETKEAVTALREQPLLGIGWARGSSSVRFVHNAYLWIVLKMGILGLLPFLWLAIRFLRRGFGGWRGVRDPSLQAIVLGGTVCFTGVAIVCLVAPYFMQDWGTAAVALIIGMNEAIFRQEQHGLPASS